MDKSTVPSVPSVPSVLSVPKTHETPGASTDIDSKKQKIIERKVDQPILSNAVSNQNTRPAVDLKHRQVAEHTSLISPLSTQEKQLVTDCLEKTEEMVLFRQQMMLCSAETVITQGLENPEAYHDENAYVISVMYQGKKVQLVPIDNQVTLNKETLDQLRNSALKTYTTYVGRLDERSLTQNHEQAKNKAYKLFNLVSELDNNQFNREAFQSAFNAIDGCMSNYLHADGANITLNPYKVQDSSPAISKTKTKEKQEPPLEQAPLVFIELKSEKEAVSDQNQHQHDPIFEVEDESSL
ncbi:MAG: hypothetical protein HAW67_03600 [Endozoicomonadaceae bacterium]|nr:hypothetical protein [Endozoicomonadaceae bacterium]MBE8232794.1 hypothetical protein [Endozoicomonadaceae bacterium]